MALDRLANSYLPVRQSSTVGCLTESTFARTAYTIERIRGAFLRQCTIQIDIYIHIYNTRDCDQSLAHQQQQRRSTSTRNLIRGHDDDNQQSALQPTSTKPTLHLAVRR